MATFRDHVQRAVELSGSQRALAVKAGLSQQMISWLLNEAPGVTAEVAIKLERATDGAVTRSDLRPDLFEPERAEAIRQGIG